MPTHIADSLIAANQMHINGRSAYESIKSQQRVENAARNGGCMLQLVLAHWHLSSPLSHMSFKKVMMIIGLDDERKKTRTTVSRQQAGSYWRQDDRRSELGSTSFGPQRAHRGAPVAPDVNRKCGRHQGEIRRR